MKKNATAGYAMAAVGLLMILYNAYGHLSGQYDASPAFGIMGLVFAGVGTGIVKKAKICPQ